MRNSDPSADAHAVEGIELDLQQVIAGMGAGDFPSLDFQRNAPDRRVGLPPESRKIGRSGRGGNFK